MINKPSTSSSQRTQRQNQYSFNIDNLRYIEISSNFENGNISLVKQIHQLYYILQSVADIENTQSKKSWFYFKIKSMKGIKVRIIVQNVSIYQNIFEQKLHCKPYYRQGINGNWQQAADSFLTFRDQVVLVIDHTFANQEDIYFCLTVPYTYTDNQNLLNSIKSNIHPHIYYKDEVLAHTCQKRLVHLLTITQNSNKKNRNNQEKKPVILITSRVHPGEVSSSFVLQGILQFLLSHNNLQAYLLRKLFIFKIIPMVNPDGVCQGNYRMDPQGYNLNRFYQNPSLEQHPAIFHITELMKKLSNNHKIQFYFDLHSHSALKQAFIYGNALDDLVSQTYSELFCKILQENYPRFRTYLSNFGEKQMKFKDKGEMLSKQGCGRVVINKLYGVIQSYTLQSSIFPPAYQFACNRSIKNQQKNKDFTYEIHQQTYGLCSFLENDSNLNIIVTQNKKLGRSILISILDMIKKNPYTRLNQDFNDNYCKDHSLRLFQNQQRFKLMDTKAYQKCKMISQLIKHNIEDKLDKEWNICGIHTEINCLHFLKDFRKISICQEAILLREKQNKMKRFKTQQREKIISKSLSKANKEVKSHLKIVSSNGQSYRSISPQQNDAHFPEIKYSIELKSVKTKQSTQLKATTIKQMKLDLTQGSAIIYEGDKIKKKIILQYIQQQISKINPDKQMFKRSNVSLNRLIANKIIEKQRAKNKNVQLSQYQKIIMQSRKRIATQCRQGLDGTQVKVFKQKLHSQGDQEMKGLQLKKAQMVKKRFITTNKAIQFIKRNDKTKIKLPDLNKLSLVVQNSKKDRERPFLQQPCFRVHSQNNVQE